MNKSKLLRFSALALIVGVSATYGYKAISSKTISNVTNSATAPVYKTDVVEKLDYELPGIEVDASTAEIIDLSESIALIKLQADLENATANLNASKQANKISAESEKKVVTKASSSLTAKTVTDPTQIEKDVDKYLENNGNSQKTKQEKNTNNPILVKSVLVPKNGTASAVISVNGGALSLVKPGQVLGGYKMIEINSNNIVVLYKGKQQTLYVAQ